VGWPVQGKALAGHGLDCACAGQGVGWGRHGVRWAMVGLARTWHGICIGLAGHEHGLDWAFSRHFLCMGLASAVLGMGWSWAWTGLVFGLGVSLAGQGMLMDIGWAPHCLGRSGLRIGFAYSCLGMGWADVGLGWAWCGWSWAGLRLVWA
jgi:hypothetical protein